MLYSSPIKNEINFFLGGLKLRQGGLKLRPYTVYSRTVLLQDFNVTMSRFCVTKIKTLQNSYGKTIGHGKLILISSIQIFMAFRPKISKTLYVL